MGDNRYRQSVDGLDHISLQDLMRRTHGNRAPSIQQQNAIGVLRGQVEVV